MLSGVKRPGSVVLERPPPPRLGVLAIWLGAVALGLAVLALVVSATGLGFDEGLRTVASATFGSRAGLELTLATSTPLILTALSVAVVRRVGLWNVGAEGQLYVGATCAAAIAFGFPESPRLFLLAAMLAAGAAGGAVWALGPALVGARRGIGELVAGLALNLAAVVLAGSLADGRWRDPLALGFPLSKALPEAAALPAIPGTTIHAGFLLALGAALLVWLVLSQAPLGRDRALELGGRERGNRIVGGGLPMRLAAAALAGALVGSAGMTELAGVAHRFHLELSPGYGYIGILVAALARFSPVGVVLVAIPVGALLVAGDVLQGLGAGGYVVLGAQVAIMAIVLVAMVLSGSRIGAIRRPR